MSGVFTDSTSRAVLDWLTGNSLPPGWTAPTNTYLALLTADPTILPTMSDGANFDTTTDPQMSNLTEVSAAGYSRQLVAWGASSTPNSQPTQIQNSTQLTFGTFTGSAGMGAPTTFGALVTSSTGSTGQVLMTWQWDNPISAAQNESIVVPVAALTMTLQ